MNRIINIAEEETKTVLKNLVSNVHKERVVIGVAGGSCVGKTSTILSYLSNLYGSDLITVSIDDFQLGENFSNRESQYRWDDPENFSLPEVKQAVVRLLEGNEVVVPVFNLDKNKRIGTKTIKPAKYVVIEGLYAFYQDLQHLSDVKIYLETQYVARLLRRIFRFTIQDGINKPDVPVKHMIGPTYLAHRDHVSLQKILADLVVEMPYSFSETYQKFNLEKIEKTFLDYVEEIYYQSSEGLVIGRVNNIFLILFNNINLFSIELEKDMFKKIEAINFKGY